jgi:3-oxoacyl-[acyl-carrier protein] reductase
MTSNEVDRRETTMDNNDLTGTVAFVTGASRGIGAATARLLGRRGAAVGVNYYRSSAAAKAVVEDIEAAGGSAIAVQADVTSEDDLASAIGTVEEVLGPLDIAVFNACALDNPARAPFVKVPMWLIEEVVTRQVRALLVPARIVLPRMASRGRGSVVVVTSTQALHPAKDMLALAMGKGAADVAVKALAKEYSPQGVRVNAIAPGPVLTDATSTLLTAEYKKARAEITPLGRLAEAEDVAGPIVALASDTCGFVTGATLQVNGGIFMA